MQQVGGMADAVLITGLAATMCQAPTPSQALLAAASACNKNLPDVVFIGLAIMARDKQSVRYATLLSSQPPAQLGAAPAASTAAGLAIHTKQAVSVRDIDTGDLAMEDLQCLRQVHHARSYHAAPLVVSQSAIGVLAFASAVPQAFTGREELLHTIAAMCAPYITLMTSNLAALEGLVKQMLPVRVALQLREQEQQESAVQLQQQHHQALPTAGAAASVGRTSTAIGAGSSSATAAAAQEESGSSASRNTRTEAAAVGAARAAMLGSRRQQQGEEQGDLDGLFFGNSHSSPWSQTTRWQRQHPLSIQLQQQHQDPASQIVQQQRDAGIEIQQQGNPQPSGNSSAMGLFMTFQPPQLERAYRISMCKQWQQLLDVLFLLLAARSAIGSRFKTGFAGDMLVDMSLLLILVVVGWGVVQQLWAMPPERYLRMRTHAIVAIRLLHMAWFVVKARHLPGAVFIRQPRTLTPAAAAAAGSCRSSLSWSQVEVAACGVLVMSGLSGQLPLAWHAVVQLVSFVALFGALNVWALAKLGDRACLAWLALAPQLVAGWVSPVAVVALVEWHTRKAFLRKIR